MQGERHGLDCDAAVGGLEGEETTCAGWHEHDLSRAVSYIPRSVAAFTCSAAATAAEVPQPFPHVSRTVLAYEDCMTRDGGRHSSVPFFVITASNGMELGITIGVRR